MFYLLYCYFDHDLHYSQFCMWECVKTSRHIVSTLNNIFIYLHKTIN